MPSCVTSRQAALCTVRFGADFQPSQVRHRDGHAWAVREVLCQWQHPSSAGQQLVTRGVVRCWRMRVWGPLPRDPDTDGEFILVARTRGNWPGWELSQGTERCECAEGGPANQKIT
jgi:hypothetical protein